MAHFAKINENNIVIDVIVIDNNILLDENGNENESLGIEYLNKYFGQANWVQTSYNNNIRYNFASIGYFYDQESDAFYYPNKPFPSWVLNDKFIWTSPIPQPQSNSFVDENNIYHMNYYSWNEDTLSWDLIEPPVK